MSSIEAALREARARGLERLDAQLLLAHVLRQSRSWLLAHGDDALTAAHAAAYDVLVARRAAGEPFAYLVGEREFHGLALAVDASVLVPRPDTETLVDWALDLLHGELRDAAAPAVLDLGTGSGAIALAIRNGCPRARLWAGERSAGALAVARANAARLALDVRFVQGDWWEALAGAADAPVFDLVVSNPPYIPSADLPTLSAEVRREPVLALDGGADGLAAYRRVVAEAARVLEPHGTLLCEIGAGQAASVVDLFAAAGFGDVGRFADLAGIERVIEGTHRADAAPRVASS